MDAYNGQVIHAIAAFALLAQAAPPAVPRYEVKRAQGRITVDGKLDEAAWNNAQVIEFVFPWDAQTGAKQKTKARLLWDDKNLYVGYEAEDIDIGQLASGHGLSRRQLERLFQAKLGVSPGRRLREFRLAHANSLLAETDMAMTEIVAACGFPSADAFRKAYRKAFGVAPSSRFRAA